MTTLAPLLARGFRRRGPWVTQFVVGGRSYGGPTDFSTDERLARFRDAFPSATRILELGSFEGGHTLALASRPGVSVVGVEGRATNVAKARFAQEALRVDNDAVRFVHADVEVVGPGAFGRFDVVFCSGLLYHLSRPYALLDRLPAAAPAAFLWTHYADQADAEHGIDGGPGRWVPEHPAPEGSGGLNRRSFWPTLEGVVERLRSAGFTRVEVVDDRPDHPVAPAATIVAR